MRLLRRNFLLLVLMGALIGLFPVDNAQAGSGLWSVWLYPTYDTQSLVVPTETVLMRVYADGSTEEHVLPVSRESLSGMSFSDSGNWIAYCAMNLYALDLGNGADGWAEEVGVTAFEYTVEQGICYGTTAFDSHDPSRLAVTVVDAGVDPTWRILVFNLITGEIEHELTAASPAMTGVEIENGVRPTLYRFDGNVIFQTVQLPVEGLPQTTGYAWNLETDTVSLDPNYSHDYRSLAILKAFDATGAASWLEAAWADFGNTLLYTNGENEYPILTRPAEQTLSSVAFVDGGRRLVVYGEDGLTAIDRNGQAQTAPACAANLAYFDRIWGLNDGFAIAGSASDENGNWRSLLCHWRFAEDGAITVDTVWENTEYQGWTIVWATPMAVEQGLDAFPAAGQ